MALFYGVDHWNSYFDALIYLKDRSMYPLQMILREILVLQEMAGTGTSMNESLAEAMHSKQQLASIIKYGVMIVSSLPVILVYPFLRKQYGKGTWLVRTKYMRVIMLLSMVILAACSSEEENETESSDVDVNKEGFPIVDERITLTMMAPGT